MSQQPPVIQLPYGDGHHIVPFAAIIYIQVNNKLSRVVTEQREYPITRSLASWLSDLPEDLFLKVHRSRIIGLSHIQVIKTNKVIVSGKEVPLSRTGRQALQEKYPKM
ncbi:LytR/AlgR family response regulator transcription factor [Flavihumibacter petaseus]|uniref:Putative LytTR family DNA-binding protein n=1 Tax=Flavihumibacter petaseus NBRC 106054 TaxID=1220578 RepID=A0A0E9MX68_9BACT|nr:putative LytTR family DNA-binding protein [Flavihumibacter petaseus NBRC 106054]